jgi:hypothetical protein
VGRLGCRHMVDCLIAAGCMPTAVAPCTQRASLRTVNISRKIHIMMLLCCMLCTLMSCQHLHADVLQVAALEVDHLQL